MTEAERAAALADEIDLLDELSSGLAFAGDARQVTVDADHMREVIEIARRAYARPVVTPEMIEALRQRCVADLGAGKYVISTGTFYDVPAVFIEDAPSPGPIGEKVPPKEREKLGVSVESTVIITHPDDSRIQAIADLMCGDALETNPSAADYPLTTVVAGQTVGPRLVAVPVEPAEAMILTRKEPTE